MKLSELVFKPEIHANYSNLYSKLLERHSMIVANLNNLRIFKFSDLIQSIIKFVLEIVANYLGASLEDFQDFRIPNMFFIDNCDFTERNMYETSSPVKTFGTYFPEDYPALKDLKYDLNNQ